MKGNENMKKIENRNKISVDIVNICYLIFAMSLNICYSRNSSMFHYEGVYDMGGQR